MTDSASKTEIELLSPARDLATGIEAINSGADAVYIGAEAFGARHAAGNSVEDIAALVKHAHLYGVRVYVTVNTILYEDELSRVRDMILRLHSVGVDALITQDTALLNMHLPIPLHASTQMNVASPEKVGQLAEWGFQQVVLARELGLKDIARIHQQNPAVRLEAFVHGALCVSYSGRCYASWHCFHRSANRGECSQFCRLAFDLEDADGHTLIHNKHLLSLKDMNRSEYLEKMMDAGVSSFKIEGRLKDAAYVKNTTAYYRAQIDAILRRRNNDYVRSSFGQSHITFTPDVKKSFNRGFTPYFIDGRDDGLVNILTPKVVGEKVGYVKEIRRGYIVVGGVSTFHNGDGLCFFTREGALKGFRANRVDNNKIFPFGDTRGMEPKTILYRNLDSNFEAALSKPAPVRTIHIAITISSNEHGFRLRAKDEAWRETVINVDAEKQIAHTPQRGAIEKEMKKCGGTPFIVDSVDILFDHDYFIPKSFLSKWRRMLIDKLMKAATVGNGANISDISAETPVNNSPNTLQRQTVPATIPFSANVSNSMARQFYRDLGASNIEPAFELHEPEGRVAIMTCKYCLRYAFGQCLKKKKCPDAITSHSVFPKQLFLRIIGEDGRTRGQERFPLEFDCAQCQMRVMKEK